MYWAPLCWCLVETTTNAQKRKIGKTIICLVSSYCLTFYISKPPISPALGSGMYSAGAQEATSAVTEGFTASGNPPSSSHDSPLPFDEPPALVNLKRHEPSSAPQKTSRPSKRRETESQTGRPSHPSSPLSSFAMGLPTSPPSSVQSGIHAGETDMQVPGPVEKTSQVARADGIEVCPGFYQLMLFLTCQQKLTKDELKAWIKDRKLPTPAKQCTKEGEPSINTYTSS